MERNRKILTTAINLSKLSLDLCLFDGFEFSDYKKENLNIPIDDIGQMVGHKSVIITQFYSMDGKKSKSNNVERRLGFKTNRL